MYPYSSIPPPPPGLRPVYPPHTPFYHPYTGVPFQHPPPGLYGSVPPPLGAYTHPYSRHYIHAGSSPYHLEPSYPTQTPEGHVTIPLSTLQTLVANNGHATAPSHSVTVVDPHPTVVSSSSSAPVTTSQVSSVVRPSSPRNYTVFR